MRFWVAFAAQSDATILLSLRNRQVNELRARAGTVQYVFSSLHSNTYSACAGFVQKAEEIWSCTARGDAHSHPKPHFVVHSILKIDLLERALQIALL